MVNEFKKLSTIAVVVLVFSVLPVSAATLSIGNFNVAPGGTVTGSLNASGVTNLGSATVNLTYNPSVVFVTAVSAGSGNALDAPVFNINNLTGLLRITADSITGKSGDVIIADITFQAVGSSGSSSQLNISIRELIDTSFNNIPATITNGGFTIKGESTPITASTSTSTSASSANPNNAPATAPATPSNGSLPIKGEDALTPAITPALTQTSAPLTVPLLATSPLETLVIIGLLGGIALLILRKRL